MAKALPQGQPIRRRRLFGAVSADGWTWASIKAFFWFLILIIALGYIPDRAYYFTVQRTLDIGLMFWSPVNLCPSENGDLPCPPPAGSVVPWEGSPSQLSLPQPRTGGSAVQLGRNLLYAGGRDASGPTASSFITTIDKGNFQAWSEGPPLPAARADAAFAVLSGAGYLIGGEGPDGKPTATVYSIGLDPDTSKLGNWATVEGLTLPAPRAGASAVAVSDGILVIGGRDADGKPTRTVWKSTIDSTGKLGKFEPELDLPHAAADASAFLEGTFVWVYGGSDENGASGAVQQGAYGPITATGTGGTGTGSAVPTPAASAAAKQGIVRWGIQDAYNLPAARTGAAGFSSNGILYLAGGSDGKTLQDDVYWAVPDSNGFLAQGWKHLDVTDLPGGLADAAPIVAGTSAILIGGTADAGPVASSVRANLAPQEPFFQLGIAGIVIPALQIPGQIGIQLGYLAAAGVGMGNFVILVIIGWALNHRPQISAWRQRRKAERAARA